MAVSWAVDNTRGSVYLFDPGDIIIKPELNGRVHAPDIEELKASIVQHGQLQPVVVRNEGDRPVLTMGFSRWTAISELNRERKPADRIKIKCVFARCNEVDGFLANWEENHRRNATTALDDAHHFAQLEKWGLSVKEISERLHVTQAFVNGRLALVSAAPEVQRAVEDGRIKPTAAAKLAKLSAEMQRKAVKGDGKISAREIASASGKPSKPNPAAVRAFIQQTADDTTQTRGVRDFCAGLLVFIDGGKGD